MRLRAALSLLLALAACERPPGPRAQPAEIAALARARLPARKDGPAEGISLSYLQAGDPGGRRVIFVHARRATRAAGPTSCVPVRRACIVSRRPSRLWRDHTFATGRVVADPGRGDRAARDRRQRTARGADRSFAGCADRGPARDRSSRQSRRPVVAGRCDGSRSRTRDVGAACRRLAPDRVDSAAHAAHHQRRADAAEKRAAGTGRTSGRVASADREPARHQGSAGAVSRMSRSTVMRWSTPRCTSTRSKVRIISCRGTKPPASRPPWRGYCTRCGDGDGDDESGAAASGAFSRDLCAGRRGDRDGRESGRGYEPVAAAGFVVGADRHRARRSRPLRVGPRRAPGEVREPDHAESPAGRVRRVGRASRCGGDLRRALVPGLRLPTFIAAGLARVPALQFVLPAIVAASLWTGALFVALWQFGLQAPSLGPVRWIVPVLVVASLLLLPRFRKWNHDRSHHVRNAAARARSSAAAVAFRVLAGEPFTRRSRSTRCGWAFATAFAAAPAPILRSKRAAWSAKANRLCCRLQAPMREPGSRLGPVSCAGIATSRSRPIAPRRRCARRT